MDNNSLKSMPRPTIRRLPGYLQVLRDMEELGEEWTSATILSEKLRLKAIQVRKDMSYVDVTGRPKLGFNTTELIDKIEDILGLKKKSKVILVGVGNLGSALLNFPGFGRYDMKISAAFDSDPQLIDTRIGNTRIHDVAKLSSYIKRSGTRFAILSVPQAVAQDIADEMVRAGISAIWNFSQSYLKAPEHVIVRREDLALSLAALQAEVTYQDAQI